MNCFLHLFSQQRISIARALVRKPSLLLLDEGTSQVDVHSEQAILEVLSKLKSEGGITTIVVAHRLRTVRDADMIVVIERGRVAEKGSHDELMKKENGIYKSLVFQ